MAVNKVILVGNVGKEPEVRHLDNDVAVANFSLATTERGFTRQNGTEVPERTEWHNIVAWRGLATLTEKYIKKGMKLYIEGSIRTRSWEDKDGVKRYTTEIFADSIELPGRGVDVPTNDAPPITSDSMPAMPTPTPTPSATITSSVPEGTADDLPF